MVQGWGGNKVSGRKACLYQEGAVSTKSVVSAWCCNKRRDRCGRGYIHKGNCRITGKNLRLNATGWRHRGKCDGGGRYDPNDKKLARISRGARKNLGGTYKGKGRRGRRGACLANAELKTGTVRLG